MALVVSCRRPGSTAMPARQCSCWPRCSAGLPAELPEQLPAEPIAPIPAKRRACELRQSRRTEGASVTPTRHHHRDDATPESSNQRAAHRRLSRRDDQPRIRIHLGICARRRYVPLARLGGLSRPHGRMSVCRHDR
jgi:hypothetical protein